MNRKQYWQQIYSTKQFTEVSWYQEVPRDSLDFVKQLGVSKTAAVIDIGGGDSYFVDHLLAEGYENITVLDISDAAINRARLRLGTAAVKVNWIVSDVTELDTVKKFDFWHDRAAFHFLTKQEEINGYLTVAHKHLNPSGKMVIGTFSDKGPDTCSGLPVKQYSESTLQRTLEKWFAKIHCIRAEHLTPFNTLQQFLFCSFQKLTNSYGQS